MDANALITLSEKLLEGLFIALRKQGSEENDYIMKGKIINFLRK